MKRSGEVVSVTTYAVFEDTYERNTMRDTHFVPDASLTDGPEESRMLQETSDYYRSTIYKYSVREKYKKHLALYIFHR